ncbi:MAG: OmpA family protein [Vibrio sp.]|uniref:OmpA family protein n=1 Tax=Vibrio sp. TaxID=678 RepID=UPI003A85AEFB
MKFLVFPLMLILAGCGSLQTDRMFNKNLLDAAPKGETDVRNPDWVAPARNANSGVRGPMGQVRTSSYAALQQFLLHNGVDYEVMPGNHVMVRLKESVQFETGSSKVSQESYHWLSMMSDFLSQQRGIDVVIDGHADATGQSSFNDLLSVKRADTVKTTLIKNNVAKEAIYTRGYGDYVPACTNRTTEGRACNRRVELLLIVSNN